MTSRNLLLGLPVIWLVVDGMWFLVAGSSGSKLSRQSRALLKVSVFVDRIMRSEIGRLLYIFTPETRSDSSFNDLIFPVALAIGGRTSLKSSPLFSTKPQLGTLPVTAFQVYKIWYLSSLPWMLYKLQC